MSESDGRATIAKWTRKQERMEKEDKNASRDMKATIKEAMKDEETHRNIARELLNARRGGGGPKHHDGYGDDEEIITGYHEDRPWERD